MKFVRFAESGPFLLLDSFFFRCLNWRAPLGEGFPPPEIEVEFSLHAPPAPTSSEEVRELRAGAGCRLGQCGGVVKVIGCGASF